MRVLMAAMALGVLGLTSGGSGALSNRDLAHVIAPGIHATALVECDDADGYLQPSSLEFNRSCFVPGSRRAGILVHVTGRSWCVAYPRSPSLPMCTGKRAGSTSS